MKRTDFFFDLPHELIAQYPTTCRRDSRLLALDGISGRCCHLQFDQVLDYLRPHDLLVFNNTKVIAARLYGYKATGGRLEALVERLESRYRAWVHLKASRAPGVGDQLTLGTASVEVLERQQGLYRLQASEPWLGLLEREGHMPLPPYIDRPDESIDQERYQTVFASVPGAVAAPTAGLHFDQALLEQLEAVKVTVGFVTLHVGAGTFKPVKVESLEDHVMHVEYLVVSAELCEQMKQCRAQRGRVIAVGTTSVRALETAANEQGQLQSYEGDTNIFIYPGYRFKCVDMMVTNFHLPESTLIMLMSAFAGYDAVMSAYQVAVQEKYRFFSYGDAMLVSRSGLGLSRDERLK